MPSKNEIILAVIGVAIIGFIIYYFFLSKKQTPQVKTHTSPLTTLTSDVGSFVSGVQSAFSKVLSAGGTVMNDIKKDIGWGEKELGNTVGIISSGASRFGRTVVTDTEHFVSGVEHVFGNVGKTLSGGVSTIGIDLESVGAKTEKTVESIPSSLKNDFSLLLQHTKIVNPSAITRLLGVSQVPKEIVNTGKTISVGVEHGVYGFVNDVRSLFSRF